MHKGIKKYLGIMFFIGLAVLAACSSNFTSNVIYEGSAKIDVYFCPRDNCDGALANALTGAKESIDCAFYELNLVNVTDALAGKSREINVRLVIDDDNLEDLDDRLLGIFKSDNRSGLMHNKFCVIDGKIVTTGSMNPTYNDAYRNNNNLLIIRSVNLANNYKNEFNELWKNIFPGERNENTEFYFNSIKLENYFCPDDDCTSKVVNELENAKQSVYFMAFSFTDGSIGNTLVKRHYDGLDIKGIFERRTESEYSKYNLLDYQEVNVKFDGNKYTMHHKVFIIDNETVITGSFNPTSSGNKKNDENLLIIHNRDIAGKYLDEFEYVWNLNVNESLQS